MDNHERAGRVADVFLKAKYGGDDEEKATDLLSDFLHWCSAYGVDFDETLARAQLHYGAELTEELDVERDAEEREHRIAGPMFKPGDRVMLTDACRLQDGSLVGKTGTVVGDGHGGKYRVRLDNPPPIPTDGIVHLYPAEITDKDTSSSASRQHFIDTGRYLKVEETEADEVEELTQKVIQETASALRSYALELQYGYDRMVEDGTGAYSAADGEQQLATRTRICQLAIMYEALLAGNR